MIKLYLQLWRESFSKKDIYDRVLAQFGVLIFSALFFLMAAPIVMIGGALLSALWGALLPIAP